MILRNCCTGNRFSTRTGSRYPSLVVTAVGISKSDLICLFSVLCIQPQCSWQCGDPRWPDGDWVCGLFQERETQTQREHGTTRWEPVTQHTAPWYALITSENSLKTELNQDLARAHPSFSTVIWSGNEKNWMCLIRVLVLFMELHSGKR